MPELAEGTGGGAPAALDITKKPEARDNREKVVAAFQSSFSLLENTPDENLTDEERWAKKAIKAAKEKTLDQGRETFSNTFEDPQTKEAFTQEEGIPVGDLLDFLRKKLASLPQDSPERQNLINWGHTLFRNSQPFSRLPHRMEPSRFVERVRQEAYFISQDSRATGNEKDDWYKAQETLNKRFELIIPQKQSTTEEGPETPSPRPGEIDVEQLVNSFHEGGHGALPEKPEPEKVTPQAEATAQELATPKSKTSPEQTLGPEAPPQTESESLKDRRYDIAIINAQESVSKLSHLKAREQINKLLRTGKWWQIWHWPRKIGLRLTEGGFLQFFKGRLQRAMNAQNSSLLTMADVRKTAGELTEAREKAQLEQRRVVERFKLGGLKTGEQQVEAQGQLRTMLINEIFRPITTGQISNPDQVREQLAVFVKNHLADPQVRALFGPEANDFGDLAEYFATDVLEIGLRVKADMETHHKTLEQIDQYINIRLGYAGLGTQQETRDFVDKAVAWAKRRRSASLTKGAKGLGFTGGVILNPFVVGVATSLGTAGGLYALGITGRVAQFSSLGVGTVLGAAAAGLRRRYELGVYDRPTHLVERALGGQIPPTGAPRREALEQSAYNTASVNDLLNGGGQELTTGTQRQSLEGLLNQDLSASQVTNRANVIRRIAEIESRRDFSARHKIDLITYAGPEQIEHGELQLVKGVAEARRALENAGMTDAEISPLETNFTGEWNQRFIQNREEQDKEFNSYRTIQALKAAAFGGAAGFAGGLVSQQAFAEIARHIPAASEIPVIGGLFQKGQTGLEKGISGVARLLGHPESAPAPSVSIETFQNLHQRGGSVDVGSKLQANVSPDHSVSIIDKATGQPVPGAPKLVIGTDGHMNATGAIPQGLHDELQQSGFQIEQGPDITQAQTITEQRPILGPDGDWTKQATNIDHREWYSYDQLGSQGNELRFYTHKEGSAVILDMRNMEQGYQKGLVPNPIDVQEVIKNHEAVWYFSGPKFSHEGIAVFDGADGTWDGQLHLNPNADPSLHINPADPKSMTLREFSRIVLNKEALQKLPDGNIATELYGRQSVFNLAQEGKMGFIEAGRIVDRNGEKVLQAFATIRGGSPLPDTIGATKEILQAVHTYDIIPPEAVAPPESPPIVPLPFAPRHPLEPLVPPPERPYYPGYPERVFPAGARLEDILRRGRPESGELRRAYRAEGGVIVDREEGERALAETRRALEEADSAYVVVGGAIGDSIIATAHLGGVQEALRNLNKNIPITLVVNEAHGDLFEGFTSANINVVRAPRGQGLQTTMERITSSSQTRPLIIDLEHYRIENPTIEVEQQGDKTITSLHNLLAPAVQLYNNSTDQERRFANYVEDLFSLPRNSINSERVIPRIELPQGKDAIYENLLGIFGIDRTRPQIAIVVESQIAEKRYPMESWASVISQISQQNPQYQFNIIFNPQSQASGFTKTDIENALRRAGVLENSRLVSGSLLEIAVLLERQNIVLSNDTGLAHIATALEHGPSVVSLHIPYFPPNSWVANPKKQTGILPPEGEVNIAGIPPEEVAQKALEILQTAAPPPGAEPAAEPPPQPIPQRATPETLAAEAATAISPPSPETTTPERGDELRRGLGKAGRALAESLYRTYEQRLKDPQYKDDLLGAVDINHKGELNKLPLFGQFVYYIAERGYKDFESIKKAGQLVAQAQERFSGPKLQAELNRILTDKFPEQPAGAPPVETA